LSAVELSGVALTTVTVLTIGGFAGDWAFTRTTRVKVATAPAARTGVVEVTVPVPPAGGVNDVNPAGAVNDTNVVLAGTTSVSETAKALLGPAFVSVIV
jgi:hypothetical protein